MLSPNFLFVTTYLLSVTFQNQLNSIVLAILCMLMEFAFNRMCFEGNRKLDRLLAILRPINVHVYHPPCLEARHRNASLVIFFQLVLKVMKQWNMKMALCRMQNVSYLTLLDRKLQRIYIFKIYCVYSYRPHCPGR